MDMLLLDRKKTSMKRTEAVFVTALKRLTLAGIATLAIAQGALAQFGGLQVDISPPSVVSAGAQWQVDDGAWHDSDACVELLIGSHTVAFSPVTGWITPAIQTVMVPYAIEGVAWTVGIYMVSVVGGFGYTTTNGTIAITGYIGPGGDVTIPNTISGLPVTSIGDYAFYNYGSVTSVTIPDSVTDIGDGAFKSCLSLTNVTIGTNVSSIGDYAFYECYSLTSVTIPNSVTSIGDWAFWGCWRLASVTIDNGVTYIGANAFVNCTSLTSVTIPDSVTDIGDGAFANCNSLTNVYFQGHTPSLGSGVFQFDNNATVYYLPGTTGWTTTFGGRPTVLWNPHVQPGSSGVRSNQFGFNITGSSNLVVVIEATSSLSNPTWTPLQSNTLNGNPLYFTDPQWTDYPGRFYRVTWP
jgi:hypothetical protein